MKKTVYFLFLFLLFVTSCKNQQLQNGSTESENYIEEVVSLLKKHSVYKNTIDWDVFRNDVYRFAKNANTVPETYPAIAYAITKLGDNHSYFVSVSDSRNEEAEKPLPVLENETVPSDIGYIRLPFCIGSDKETERYIDSITEKIASQNTKNTKGWIVDLRDNFGGNMWPMLVAIGPLLSEGGQGYFFDAEDQATQWQYRNGKAYADAKVLAENKKTITLIQRPAKIAVLTNAQTASSGEAMTVVFKGNANTKSFGEKTYGVSTGCESFTLSDGSRINLATSVFVDRNKQKYGSRITPDIECSSSEALEKAIQWINK